jgi:hypothetical protein
LNYVISYKFRKTWIYESKNWILPIIIFQNSTLCKLAVLPHEAYEVCIPLELYIFLVKGEFYIIWHLNLGFYAFLTDKFCGTLEGTTPPQGVGICHQSTQRHVSEDQQHYCHQLISRTFRRIFAVPVLCLYYAARTKNLINRPKNVRFPPESVTCKLSLKSAK